MLTESDSEGTVLDKAGWTPNKLALLMEIVNVRHGSCRDYADLVDGALFLPGLRPWSFRVDVALPCAGENEVDWVDAWMLIQKGLLCLVEGANMACTATAIAALEVDAVLFGPSSAGTAGALASRPGVRPSALDLHLRQFMQSLHASCVRHGSRPDGTVNHREGASVAGFLKLADAMLSRGVH